MLPLKKMPKAGKKRRKRLRDEIEHRKRRDMGDKKSIPYDEYLRTKWWRKKRKQKMNSVLWKCERCGGHATDVHHLHYRSLWNEGNCDLEALCRNCHHGEHDWRIQCDDHLRSIRFFQIYPKKQ